MHSSSSLSVTKEELDSEMTLYSSKISLTPAPRENKLHHRGIFQKTEVCPESIRTSILLVFPNTNRTIYFLALFNRAENIM
jgi:hypothetical protein